LKKTLVIKFSYLYSSSYTYCRENSDVIVQLSSAFIH